MLSLWIFRGKSQSPGKGPGSLSPVFSCKCLVPGRNGLGQQIGSCILQRFQFIHSLLKQRSGLLIFFCGKKAFSLTGLLADRGELRFGPGTDRIGLGHGLQLEPPVAQFQGGTAGCRVDGSSRCNIRLHFHGVRPGLNRLLRPGLELLMFIFTGKKKVGKNGNIQENKH